MFKSTLKFRDEIFASIRTYYFDMKNEDLPIFAVLNVQEYVTVKKDAKNGFIFCLEAFFAITNCLSYHAITHVMTGKFLITPPSSNTD